MENKYIIFKSSGFEGEFPVVFPNYVSHDLIGNAMTQAYTDIKPISAGFCSHFENGVNNWGKSVSLELSSHAEDKGLLEQLLVHEVLGG